MKDKLYDFGILGKWSKGTLIAQSRIDSYGDLYLPEGIRDKYNKLREGWYEIDKLKIKKMTVSRLKECIDIMNHFEEIRDIHTKIMEIVWKLLRPKKENKK